MESFYETSNFKGCPSRQTWTGCSAVRALRDGLGIPHSANLWHWEVFWRLDSRHTSHIHPPRDGPLTAAELVCNSEEKVWNHEEYLTWSKPGFHCGESYLRSTQGWLLGPPLKLPLVPIVDATIRTDLWVDGNAQHWPRKRNLSQRLPSLADLLSFRSVPCHGPSKWYQNDKWASTRSEIKHEWKLQNRASMQSEFLLR